MVAEQKCTFVVFLTPEQKEELKRRQKATGMTQQGQMKMIVKNYLKDEFHADTND